MCQDGAIGMALIGYSARQILAFYYPGTRLETLNYAGPQIDSEEIEPVKEPVVLASARIQPVQTAQLLPLEGPINPTQISALKRQSTPSETRKSNILNTLKEISTVRAGNTASGVRKMFWTPSEPGLSKNRGVF